MFQKSVTGSASSPFEHLAARLNLTSAKKAEDDEDKKKDAKADDEGDDSKDKAKKSKKAKNEDDERGDEEEKLSAEKEEEDDGDKEDKKSKKSKSKSKASDDDKKDDDKDDKKEARAAERERIREIVDSKEAAASNDALFYALDLALNTDQDASTALVGLRAFNRALGAAEAAVQKIATASVSTRGALAQRMSQSPNPDLGVDGSGGSEPTLAEKIIMAGKKRRGEI
jgi:murein DD-endopeptidase MepM/ murein hydrolase activator NlpD